MSSIGPGGPNSPLREEWPAPIVVLEALSRFVPPETIRAVLTQTGRHSQRIRQLPATAVKYIRRIEELIEAPVALLSTSPERDDTILVHNPFET